MDSIKNRRSIRKYTDKMVSKKDIEEIIQAAMLAPSAKNRQPWKYIVYTMDSKDRILDVMEKGLIRERDGKCILPYSSRGLTDAFNTLKIMRQAPILIMVMNPGGFSPFDQLIADDRITEICDSLSIGASIQNMLLTATEKGIGSLWIANTCFAYTELEEYLEMPGQLVGAVILGYADEDPAPRPRKALKDVIEYR